MYKVLGTECKCVVRRGPFAVLVRPVSARIMPGVRMPTTTCTTVAVILVQIAAEQM